MKVIIPAGIGLALSIAAAILNGRKRNVAAWMKARRIDRLPSKNQNGQTCGVCGQPMKIRQMHTGERAGTYWVCTQWPDCRKVEKIE